MNTMAADSALVRTRAAAPAASRFADLRSWIVDLGRRINWFAVAVTLALEALILAALFSLGIASLTDQPKEERLAVLDIRETRQQTAPPASPVETQDEVTPVIQPQRQVDLIAPQPAIEVARTEQAVTATLEPARPAPAASAAPKATPAPPAASPGPVSVPNLNTNLLSGAPPSYPNASRRKREQGTVVLRLVISEDGRVASVSVSRSSGFAALDEAATAAVSKWRWSPTIRDGRPTAITGLVQIPFVLKGA